MLTGCTTAKHEADNQTRLQAEAKVSKSDAEKIALARIPNGTVKEGELEREKGKLIWSFDITVPDSKDVKEVTVNALTGEVVSVETESPRQESKEKD